MQTINPLLVVAIRRSNLPQYRLCQIAGVNPVFLSHVLNGIREPHLDDERLQRIANIIGFDGLVTVEDDADELPNALMNAAKTTARRTHV